MIVCLHGKCQVVLRPWVLDTARALTPEENPADFQAPQSSAMHIQQLVCLLLLTLKLCLIGTHRLVHFKCYQTPLLTLSSLCLAYKLCSAEQLLSKVVSASTCAHPSMCQ